MKKSFLEGLEKQHRNKVSSKTIVFLYKTQIIEALNSGFTVLDIYNYMVSENLYPYSYSSFSRTVKNADFFNEDTNKNEADDDMPINESNKPKDSKILAAKKEEPLKFNPKADISKLI